MPALCHNRRWRRFVETTQGQNGAHLTLPVSDQASQAPHDPKLCHVFVGRCTELVLPVLVLDAEEELIRMAGHGLAEIQAKLRLRENPPGQRQTEFIHGCPDVLRMLGEPERLVPDIEGGAPARVNHEAVGRPRRAAAVEPVAVVDEGSKVGIEEDETGNVQRETRSRQVLEHVGIAVEVDPADECDIPEGTGADGSTAQLGEAQDRVSLAVEFLVVEAVDGLSVQEVDEDEAVAQRPARRLLNGQNRGVVPFSGERIREPAVLVVELGLGNRARGRREQNRGNEGDEPDDTKVMAYSSCRKDKNEGPKAPT